MRTQKQIVLDLLTERGERGVSAREAIYDLHITRLAAIIFDLRQDGFTIRSETKKGETARYYLSVPTQRQQVSSRVCTCGHRYRQHIYGATCLAITNEPDRTAPAVYCGCQKFTEQKEMIGG